MTGLRRSFMTVLVGILALGFASRAWADLSETIPTVEGAGVRIEATGPTKDIPADGCFFCWVTIKNYSGAPHTWDVRCEITGRYDHNDSAAISQSLRVESNSSARLPVLLPLTSSSKPYYYQGVNLTVEGYGTEGKPVSLGYVNNSGVAHNPFVGMGDTLATPIWTSLEKNYVDRHTALFGAPVTPALLSPDWRALAGFGCLWLADADYAALDAGQRAAIHRWVEQGGTFYLSARMLDPAQRASLGLPETGVEGHPGYGVVKWLPWDGKALDLDGTAAIIDGLHSPRTEPTARDAATWNLLKSVGAIPVNAPFLLCFIGLFAVVAGPVNLFVLAPASRRHRLFWTTPLISAVASVLLIVVILFQDGFGGHGERLMVTRLFPGERQAVVVQEQVARTGVLLSRRFTLPEDTLLTPLGVPAATNRHFEQAGRECGGDWFMSRLVQAHRAEAIVPSRAEVQLLNPAEAEGGAAPVVVSTIPATLRDIAYRTRAGEVWHGSNLHTGERITLRQDGVAVSTINDGSSYLDQLQNVGWSEIGSFFAVADEGPFIETLPAIRWRKQRAVFLGPITPVR